MFIYNGPAYENGKPIDKNKIFGTLSMAEYEQMKKENETLKAENESLRTEIDGLYKRLQGIAYIVNVAEKA